MRKLFTVAAAGIAILGWSGQSIANPDPHPTQAPKDGEHKDEHHDGDHKGDHHDGEHKEEHKPAH
ncbi:MAG: hypothetical protein RIS85_2254 [Pseudomonadota bacterium]